MVWIKGFEPLVSWSQAKRFTKLSYIQKKGAVRRNLTSDSDAQHVVLTKRIELLRHLASVSKTDMSTKFHHMSRKMGAGEGFEPPTFRL